MRTSEEKNPNAKSQLVCAAVDETALALQFPNVARGHGPSAAPQPDTSHSNVFFVNVIPSLNPVSYLTTTGTGPDLTQKPGTFYFFPTLVTVDYMHRFVGGQYLLGFEFGGGAVVPQSVSKSSTLCTTISQTGSTPQTMMTLQNCGMSGVTTATPQYGGTALATIALAVSPVPIGTTFLPGFELLATFQTSSDPSAKTPVGIFSSSGDTLSFTLPIFLTKAGAPWSILGGVAPQMTVPFDGTAPKPAVAFFVGSGLFGAVTGSGSGGQGGKGGGGAS